MSSVKQNLRFFAVVENDMTLWQNEREVQLKVCVHLFGCIRRHSVLSSFNCNLFSVIEFFISEVHFLTEVIGLWTSWGGIEVLIQMSSTNKWTLKEYCFIRSESGCIFRTNKGHPNTLCGTPWWSSFVDRMRLAIATDCLLFDKYEQSHYRHVTEIQYKQLSLSKRMSWSAVSNAEDRSSSVNRDKCLLSRAKRISFAVFRSRVSGLWWGLNADWEMLWRLLWSK